MNILWYIILLSKLSKFSQANLIGTRMSMENWRMDEVGRSRSFLPKVVNCSTFFILKWLTVDFKNSHYIHQNMTKKILQFFCWKIHVWTVVNDVNLTQFLVPRHFRFRFYGAFRKGIKNLLSAHLIKRRYWWIPWDF